MAIGRLDVPSVALYSGTIYPGFYKGERSATVVTVYEAIGAYRAGKISLDELYEVENAACPGTGAPSGAKKIFTGAPSRSSATTRLSPASSP